ncbi:MAG: hypothetical protein IKK08_06530, partial [Clostridia bacterium]|nr:hypothetical protein [Clostridia bacterium]
YLMSCVMLFMKDLAPFVQFGVATQLYHMSQSFFSFLLLSNMYCSATYLTASQGAIISTQSIGNWLSDGLWDILMIKMNGMNNNTPLLNVPAWTLSAMLISEFIAFSCMHNNQKLFTTMVVPMTIVIGLGIWRHIPSASHQLWMGFTTFGLLRVWILYCLSWYCHKLMLSIKMTQWTKSGIVILTICELLCYALAISVIMSQTSRNYRWFATLLLFVAVAISISGKSASASILTNKTVIFWIGELSMGVYLTHYPIMQVFRAQHPGETVLHHFTSFVCAVIVTSVLFSIAIVKGKKLLSACCQKTKSKLIVGPSAGNP